MLKIENTDVYGFGPAIRGMRNSWDSWENSDSYPYYLAITEEDFEEAQTDGIISEDAVFVTETPCTLPDGTDLYCGYHVGENDLALMKKLVAAGSDHRKFMRMIVVWADITAPLYWWKEFDTYKVGTVGNSCSTMHTIAKKSFTLDDFSHENLWSTATMHLMDTIKILNIWRDSYNHPNACDSYKKHCWWQMIQLLPTSYNQRRTEMLNYEVLRNMYHARRKHKLDEWHTFCEWVESLPYSELITED